VTPRCDGRRDRRLTFADDLGHLRRLARRTIKLTALMLGVANAADGERGSRLANALGTPISPDRLLRVPQMAEGRADTDAQCARG
jgi:hypothetical protein